MATRPNRIAIALLAIIFALALLGPWAWFNVATPIPAKWLVFHAQTKMSGYNFKPEVVAEEALETLATTNIVNGVYFNANNRFYAFAADWLAKDARQMSVVQHTPDICWIGAGFELAELGQPTSISLDLQGETVPFECRVFRVPQSGHHEMVLWCTLVSGQVLEEGNRFASHEDNSSQWRRSEINGRLRAASQFVRTVSGRIRGDGSKQFVRFSAPVTTNWKDSLQMLSQFASKWLEVEVQHPVPKA
ncbi:MAG TPA: hypothetical protein VMF06_15595 [Candidatus Limnocylindria bacterium]|jgi:hypothetical protein|nr:hypothetical protein [Candidatus Limnocylindria bacterium]